MESSNECSALLQKRDESLVFQFHHIHNIMFRLANQMLEESAIDLKMKQIPILITLFWLEDQSQQEVADRLRRDKSSVLRTVKGLQGKGLVEIKKDKEDGRRKVLVLTGKGRQTTLQINALIREIETKIFHAFTDRPKDEFIQLLKEATRKLEAAIKE